MVIEINKSNFNQLVMKNEKKVLLDFYADWCYPCRMTAPVVEKISEMREDVFFGKVNVDNEPELARAFGVTNIPMLAVVSGGVLVNAAVGAMPEEDVLKLIT